MQFHGRFYVRYFNFTHQRTGTLYEGRFKSSIVQDQHYLLACQRYIELNPVRAGIVSDPADYPWSSYRAHAFGLDVRMWTPHPEYLALGKTKASRWVAYRNLFISEPDSEGTAEIRKAVNAGLVLGDDCFRKEVEQLTGQRQHHLKRGPKPEPKPREKFLL
jgi:putative transposase